MTRRSFGFQYLLVQFVIVLCFLSLLQKVTFSLRAICVLYACSTWILRNVWFLLVSCRLEDIERREADLRFNPQSARPIYTEPIAMVLPHHQQLGGNQGSLCVYIMWMFVIVSFDMSLVEGKHVLCILIVYRCSLGTFVAFWIVFFAQQQITHRVLTCCVVKR